MDVVICNLQAVHKSKNSLKKIGKLSLLIKIKLGDTGFDLENLVC